MLSHFHHAGVALIAAKSYYFGVGGSVAAFQALVAAEGAPEFGWRTVRTFEDGASNRREVVAVTRAKAKEARSQQHTGAPQVS